MTPHRRCKSALRNVVRTFRSAPAACTTSDFATRSKNTTIRLLASLALALTTAVAAYGQAPPSAVAPIIGCTVLVDDATARAGQPIRISNLKRVPMRATLIGPQDSADSLRLANPNASGRDASQPTVDVVVRRTADPARARVETRAVETGHGLEPGQQHVDITLEIPIDRATRRANVERYLERLGQESAKAGKGDQFKRLTENREVAIASFERLYMENMVGDYDVTCAYSAQRPGRAKVNIESSPPIKLQVFFESSFFDQPTFR